MSPKRIRIALKHRNGSPRVLVIRNDGLGDFIHSLPFISSLKKQLPQSRIYTLVHRSNRGLLPMLPEIDGMILDPGVLLKRHKRSGQYEPDEAKRLKQNLLDEIKAYRFDAAVFLYAEKDSAALIQKAGIPIRVGPMRRPWFMKFNAWNAQSRKDSDLPEYELNLEYLRVMGFRPRFEFPEVSIPSAAPEITKDAKTAKTKSRKNLKKKAVKARTFILHPVKRNPTALSWSEARFRKLLRELIKQKNKVILIGDSSDEKALKKFIRPLNAAEKKSVTLKTDLSLLGLSRLFREADFFIGNSSGPLQLAGLLKVPHVGLFPQNHVSSIYRWQTLPFEQAPDQPESYLLMPDFDKSCIRCEGESCEFFNCVDSISVDSVLEAIEAWGS